MCLAFSLPVHTFLSCLPLLAFRDHHKQNEQNKHTAPSCGPRLMFYHWKCYPSNSQSHYSWSLLQGPLLSLLTSVQSCWVLIFEAAQLHPASVSKSSSCSNVNAVWDKPKMSLESLGQYPEVIGHYSSTSLLEMAQKIGESPLNSE